MDSSVDLEQRRSALKSNPDVWSTGDGGGGRSSKVVDIGKAVNASVGSNLEAVETLSSR